MAEGDLVIFFLGVTEGDLVALGVAEGDLVALAFIPLGVAEGDLVALTFMPLGVAEGDLVALALPPLGVAEGDLVSVLGPPLLFWSMRCSSSTACTSATVKNERSLLGRREGGKLIFFKKKEKE